MDAAMDDDQSDFFLGLCRPADPPWRRLYFKTGPTYGLNYVPAYTGSNPGLRRRSDCGEGGSRDAQPALSIEFVRASFQRAPAKLLEDDTYLSVVLPEFRAEAGISVKQLHGSSSSQWQLGWITAVSRHDIAIDYDGTGNGGKRVHARGSWEVPVMHMSTSDLTSPPWLSPDACVELRSSGDADASPRRRVVVQMHTFDDRFLPLIPWKLVSSHNALYATRVTFDMEYYGWLTLKNAVTGSLRVLKTLVWTRQIAVDISCADSVGSRASISSPLTDNIVNTRRNFPLPEWTVVGPSAKQELSLLCHLAKEQDASAPYVVVEGKNYKYPILPRM